jgi:hypothetical protein
MQNWEKDRSTLKNCGGECTFTTFNDYCQTHGIKRQLTQVLTPQQNGVGKRGNCTIVEKAKNTQKQLIGSKKVLGNNFTFF